VTLAFGGGQMVITPEAGFLGRGDERLVPQLTETDPVGGGERVRDGERDPAGLGEQHLDPHVVLSRERQPQQGRVDVAVGQSGGGVRPGGLLQVHPPARPAAAERRDDLLGGLVGGAGHETHPQHPGRPAGRGPGLPQHLVPACQHAGDPAGQRLARRGQRHPGPGPGEQLDPELALQLLDLLGQRGLGHEQPLGRAAEAAFGRDGGEVAQQPGVDIHAIRL
jgi:hypothetical protein